MFSGAMTRRAGILGLVILIVLSVVTAGASPELMKALGILEPRERIAVPDFTLSTLQGKPFSFKDLKGKVILVNFFATWCLPCQWEMPEMEKLYQAYKAKGFVVVAIALDREGAPTVEPFVKERKLTYLVVLDQSLIGARQFGIIGLPATFLIGRDGFIKGLTYGAKEWDGPEARALIESLLGMKKDLKG